MSNTTDRQAFLGRGIGFPLRLDPRGGLALTSPEQDIAESIRIILSTRPGERVMRPEFGCRAHDLLFAPRNAQTEALMQQYVAEALAMWEPRIDVLAVNVSMEDGLDGGLYVEVEYQIKATHDERSIVYPFFIEGAEDW